MKAAHLVFILLMALVSVMPSRAQAESVVHGGLYLGGWRSSFSQVGSGQTASLTSDFAPAFQFTLGVDIGPVFAEYTPLYYLAYFDRRDLVGREEANDVSSWSLKAFNIGVRIPFVKLRPYVGSGVQHYDFRSGTDVSFSGTFIRAGLGWDIFSKDLMNVELKAEYQRIFLDDGGAGSMPSNITTRANIWTVFLGFRGGR